MMSVSPFKNSKLLSRVSNPRIFLTIIGALLSVLIFFTGIKFVSPFVKDKCRSLLENSYKAEREARIASVETMIVKPSVMFRRLSALCKLRANQLVTLRSEMRGRIKEIAFKEGSIVKKGDILIRFEDEELEAEVAKVEAEVEYRQARFNRLERLQPMGLKSGIEYDHERGQLNIAKANLEVARVRLAKATIHAPFEGKIGLINVSAGSVVDSSTELAALVDAFPMKVDFKVAEKFFYDIGIGQSAEVLLDSMPGQIFQATVDAIDSCIDSQTYSIAARAIILNENEKLQPGLFGRINIIVGIKNDALMIPEMALCREGEIEYVWIVVNGKAGRKRVLTGIREKGQVEITAGLKPNEIVVIAGQHKLSEGRSVRISNIEGNEVELNNESHRTNQICQV
jgi:membrane fusion protein (multidrug efflux system)